MVCISSLPDRIATQQMVSFRLVFRKIFWYKDFVKIMKYLQCHPIALISRLWALSFPRI